MANVLSLKFSLGSMLCLGRGHFSSLSLTSYTVGNSNPVSTWKCHPSLGSHQPLKTNHGRQHPVWSAPTSLSVSISPHSPSGSPGSSHGALGPFPWLGCSLPPADLSFLQVTKDAFLPISISPEYALSWYRGSPLQHLALLRPYIYFNSLINIGVSSTRM